MGSGVTGGVGSGVTGGVRGEGSERGGEEE